jgi:hypothetical protein
MEHAIVKVAEKSRSQAAKKLNAKRRRLNAPLKVQEKDDLGLAIEDSPP